MAGSCEGDRYVDPCVNVQMSKMSAHESVTLPFPLRYDQEGKGEKKKIWDVTTFTFTTFPIDTL